MKVHLPPISTPKHKGYSTPKSELSSFVFPKGNRTYSISGLNGLDRTIKSNNVTQFLGDNRIFSGGEKQENNIELEERNELIHNLLHIRKRLDEVKEQCEKINGDTTKLKRESDNLRDEEENRAGGINDAGYKIGQLTDAMEYQKKKIDEGLHSQATYYHMLDRLKKDKMSDKIKVNSFEEEYVKKYHELTLYLEQVKQSSEFYNKTKQFSDDMKKQVHLEEHQRFENLNTLEQTLSAREEYEYNREKRTEHIQNIADSAANEVDDDQKRWAELLMTHKFVQFFLKNKIDRQVKKYETVEKAFQKIKAATGLTDLSEIISRFLGREEKYSELLVSIAETERKVNEERKVNDELKAKLREFKERGLELDKIKEERRTGKGLVTEAQKELNIKINEHKKSKLVLESTHKWALRTLKRVDKAQNILKNDYEEFCQDKLPVLFMKLFENVKKNLDVLKEKENDQELNQIEKFNSDLSLLSQEFMAKNMRVHPQTQKIYHGDGVIEITKRNGSRAYIEFEEDNKEGDDGQNNSPTERQNRGT